MMLKVWQSRSTATRHVSHHGRFTHHTSSESRPKSFLLDQTPKAPLPPQSATDVAEREAFKNNLAAQTLGSPVRMCQITRSRLPSALLIPFTLAPHPTLPQDWIMPDYAKRGARQRRYVVNSRRVLESLAGGAWKKIQFPSAPQHGAPRRRVWRPDMVACVERDMARHAPHLKLND